MYSVVKSNKNIRYTSSLYITNHTPTILTCLIVLRPLLSHSRAHLPEFSHLKYFSFRYRYSVVTTAQQSWIWVDGVLKLRTARARHTSDSCRSCLSSIFRAPCAVPKSRNLTVDSPVQGFFSQLIKSVRGTWWSTQVSSSARDLVCAIDPPTHERATSPSFARIFHHICNLTIYCCCRCVFGALLSRIERDVACGTEVNECVSRRFYTSSAPPSVVPDSEIERPSFVTVHDIEKKHE